jgi:hypothetical protein
MIRAINSCSTAAKASKKIAGGLDNLTCMGVGASKICGQLVDLLMEGLVQ